MKSTAAESLVVTLETTPLGAPWFAAHTAAEKAVAADRDAAECLLFPTEIQPVSGDALVAYRWHTERLNVVGYGDALAVVHRRSIRTYDALATCCRSQEALQDVTVAAADVASRIMKDQAQASAAAVRDYKRTIAAQLATVDGHELQPAARVYVAAIARGERLDAARARHEHHAAAEQARLEAAAREAARSAEEAAEQRAIDAETEISSGSCCGSTGCPATSAAVRSSNLTTRGSGCACGRSAGSARRASTRSVSIAGRGAAYTAATN
jgi:hypothetical protein